MESEVKDRVGGFLKKLGQYKYVMLVLALGVVLLLIPAGGGTEESEEAPSEPVAAARGDGELEARLEEILSLIDGAGEVRVLLTRSSDGESVLAADSERTDSSGSDGRSQESRDAVIVSKGSGANDTVEVKYLYPEFRGAAQGADSARVSLDLLDAVTAATGLPGDCVKIVKMK